MNSNYTILIIEDEKLILEALKNKFTSEGFNVVIATDGEEGLKSALEVQPSIILLDLILPKLDGLTLLDKLRGDDRGKSIPVIILTNLSNALSASESKAKGVNSYLVKTDWKLDEVVAKVKEELKI